MTNWAKHQAECNVITVPDKRCTAFVPYYGEDDPEMTPELAERIDPNGAAFQTYIVNYWDPSGKLLQHTVPPLVDANIKFRNAISGKAYGADPGQYRELRYDLEIIVWPKVGVKGSSVKIEGLILGDTAIFKGSQTRAGLLVKKNWLRLFGRDTTNLAVWPSPEVIRRAINSNPDFVIPRGEPQLQILMLKSDDKTVLSNLYGTLVFPRLSYLMRSGREKLPFVKDFELKLGPGSGVKVDAENLFMIRGKDKDTGDILQMIFETSRDKTRPTVELMDIEIHIPFRRFERVVESGGIPVPAASGSAIPYRIDANDAGEMNGLLMRLQDLICDDLVTEFDKEFELLEKHREKLESDPDYKATPKIQATVEDAVRLSWEHMGRQAGVRSKRYYRGKIGKGFTENAVTSAQNIWNALKSLNNEKKSRKRDFKKKRLLRSAKALESVILDELKNVSLSDQQRKQLQDALEWLNQLGQLKTVELDESDDDSYSMSDTYSKEEQEIYKKM